MPNTTRVGLYARVSVNAQNPELQLAELRQYALRRNWQIVGEFVDVGVSGSKESRPKLDALMLAAKRRQVDVIACWKLDRFGRSLRHLVNALAELEAVGCTFVSLRDNLDLSTPAGRMLFQVIGAMAEFERQLIRERVRAGIANAKAKGKTLGRPRRIVDSARIASLRAQGRGWKAVAREMGLGVSTVLRAAQMAGLKGSENLAAAAGKH